MTTLSNIAFNGMSFLFKIRDLISPWRTVLEETGLRLGDRVLDYGCGPGGYTVAAARLVGPGGEVYALDTNPIAASAVRRTAAKERLDHVTVIVADSPADVPSRRVDVAILHDVLHELDDPSGVIAGLDRSLKRGGLLAVSDHHMSEAAILAAVSSGRLFEVSRSFQGVYCFKPIERA